MCQNQLTGKPLEFFQISDAIIKICAFAFNANGELRIHPYTPNAHAISNREAKADPPQYN